MAHIISSANTCKILVVPGRNTIVFVGREANRQICSYLFKYLCREVEAFAQKDYDKAYYQYHKHGKGSIYGWKAALFQGFLDSIRTRLTEIDWSIREEVGEEKYAIVSAEKAVVQHFVDSLTLKKIASTFTPWSSNIDGHLAGSKFGQDVSICRGVAASKCNQQKVIE